MAMMRQLTAASIEFRPVGGVPYVLIGFGLPEIAAEPVVTTDAGPLYTARGWFSAVNLVPPARRIHVTGRHGIFAIWDFHATVTQCVCEGGRCYVDYVSDGPVRFATEPPGTPATVILNTAARASLVTVKRGGGVWTLFGPPTFTHADFTGREPAFTLAVPGCGGALLDTGDMVTVNMGRLSFPAAVHRVAGGLHLKTSGPFSLGA